MSAPSFNPDDPRLTAYALGEADENERLAVEDWLAQSVEARAEVEQTRALARVLAAEYAQENENYLASRPAVALPSRNVAFPHARLRLWRHVPAAILKAAAVLALASPFIYLLMREMHRPVTGMVASAPPSASLAAPPPAPAAESLPQSATASAAADDDRVASTDADAPGSPRAAMAPAASVAKTSPAPLLAMESDKAASRAVEQTPRAAVVADSSRFASTLRAAPATLPANAKAAIKPALPAFLDENAVPRTVRVRCSDGRFFGGVIVSPDGLILAATTLPEETVRRPSTVVLPDQREVAAVAERSPLGDGWYWLRIEAHGLTAASLAENSPRAGAMLTVPVVNETSGNLAFSHVRAGTADLPEKRDQNSSGLPPAFSGETVLAFDPGGGLLVFGPPAPPAISAAGRRAVGALLVPSAAVARPFTAAEQEIVRRAIAPGKQR